MSEQHIHFSRRILELGGADRSLATWEVGPQPQLTLAEVEALREVVESAADERPIQAHLTDNPRLFLPLLSGRFKCWVRPQVRLGDRYVADFMIADEDSVGMQWQYVELESPGAKMFKQNGELAEKARHGIHQIQQWRDYVDYNSGLARRPRAEGGLGLPEVRAKNLGVVIVGRREGRGADSARERRRLLEENRIALHSYDWLLDRVLGAVEGA